MAGLVEVFCGHREPRSTELYAKLADQAVAEAIRRPQKQLPDLLVRMVEAAGSEPAAQRRKRLISPGFPNPKL